MSYLYFVPWWVRLLVYIPLSVFLGIVLSWKGVLVVSFLLAFYLIWKARFDLNTSESCRTESMMLSVVSLTTIIFTRVLASENQRIHLTDFLKSFFEGFLLGLPN